MTFVGWGRPDFYFDPPATRQDRAEAWAWNQQQDRDTARLARPITPLPPVARTAAERQADYDRFMDAMAGIVAPFKEAA